MTEPSETQSLALQSWSTSCPGGDCASMTTRRRLRISRPHHDDFRQPFTRNAYHVASVSSSEAASQTSAMAKEIYGEASESDRDKAERMAKRRETSIRQAVAAALDGMVQHQSPAKFDPNLLEGKLIAIHRHVFSVPALARRNLPPVRRGVMHRFPRNSALSHASISSIASASKAMASVFAAAAKASTVSRQSISGASRTVNAPTPSRAPSQRVGRRPSLRSGTVLPALETTGAPPPVPSPPAAPTGAPPAGPAQSPGLPGPHDDYDMWDNLWIYGSSDGGWDIATSLFHIALVVLILFIIFAAIAASCYGSSGRGGGGGQREDLGGWAAEGLRSAAHSAEELLHTASRSASESWDGIRASVGGGGGGAAGGGSSKPGTTVSV